MMVIQKFLDYIAIERKYSNRTVEAYRDDLNAFCAYLNLDPNAYDPKIVDESDIRGWLIELLDEGHSPRSIKRYLSSLRSFYKFMLRVGAIDKDITRKIIAPKEDKPLPVFFRESEMQQATAYESQADDFESKRNCLIIEMLYQTGMRQAEMLGLTDNDIDLTQGQIRIFGKRRKERIVPIGEALINQIKDYLAARQELGSVSNFFVRVKRNGEVVSMDKGTLYKIVRTRMREVSTLKKVSPHVLRHTFATTMLNNGADIRTIQTLMGHASLAATQVYTHTTFEQVRKAYNQAHPRAKKQKTEY
ncbi:MAG: tyrosine-type recombinase/integrase [Paludibacteraceae bacterium]|nr:tyrosine-type recombinase/integrase [Paludibacteraceae bacterium]